MLDLQKMQQEAAMLAEGKQRGLHHLKHLTGQQQALDAQLHQARQDSEASIRKLARLQEENSRLQVTQKPCTAVCTLSAGCMHG